MSTKGMSNTSARRLVDNLCTADVPLLILHDFDKSGFSICATIAKSTPRYKFKNDINVIDLGMAEACEKGSYGIHVARIIESAA
jgi:hypothetical protein